MIVRPNFLAYYLARGRETGSLSVSCILDGVTLWRKEHAHSGAITELTWSCDGQLLASGSQDGMVCVWTAETGNLLSAFSHGEWVQRLRWSPQGVLASTSDTIIHIWTLAATTPVAV